jgi:hypothetical protein
MLKEKNKMAEAICENCGARYNLNGKVPKFACVCRSKKFKIKN